MFQVLNHNRTGTFRVKQRLTLYFVRDVDLFGPIDATSFYSASIWVPIDKANPEAIALDKRTCHCCAPLVQGLEATNNVSGGRVVDAAGRALVGHWVVPPGRSTWSFPLAKMADVVGATPKKLFATWTHVHPFATEVRLTVHEPGCAPRIVTTSKVESLRDGRVGLLDVRSFRSEEGVTLPSGAAWQLSVDYDNTSGRAQDSMTTLGLFVEDASWTRPPWAARAQNGTLDRSCGTGP